MIGRVRIAIVGFGLIGGSIARALRRPEAARIVPEGIELAAWSRRPAAPRSALAAGIIDSAPLDLVPTVAGADLIVIAAPPVASLELLRELAGPLRARLAPTVVVTDVASTKRAIVEEADRLELRFVGGHPMAGRESSGFDASVADLFVDRPWVVCPGLAAAAADVALVENLARWCGARPIRLEPAIHDAAAATISHVPLIVASALVEALADGPGWPLASTLAASGWRDMTRLARGDPAMGGGIAVTNAAEIAAGLRRVRTVLEAWIATLDGPDPELEAIVDRLTEARRRLEPS
jgi:prephenate dehydrogenase